MRPSPSNGPVFMDILLKSFIKKGDLKKETIIWIAEQLKEVFGLEKIYLVQGHNNGDFLTSFDELSDTALLEAIDSKEIAICDEDRQLFDCTIQTNDSLSSITSIHNQLTLSLNEKLITDLAFKERFVLFSEVAAKKMQPDFCFICDIKYADYKYGINMAGLANGLRDIYWVNIFGPPFVRLIGEEKLLNVSSAKIVEKLGDTLIMLVLDGPDENIAQQEKLKTEIGEQYFLRCQGNSIGKVSAGGLFSLINHLRKLGRQNQKVELAETLPTFYND